MEAKKPTTEETQDWLLIGIITLLFLALLFIKLPVFFRSKTGSKEPIGYISMNGKAARRPSGQLNWEMVNGGGPIYQNDFVFTTDAGGAEVELKKSGSKLQLTPNTVVQIYEDGAGSAEVVLIQGEAQMSNGGPRLIKKRRWKQADVISPLAATTVKPPPPPSNIPWLTEPPNAQQAALDDSWKRLKFHNVQLEAVRDPASHQRFQDSLNDYELRLVTPPQNASLSNEWIILSWTPVPLRGTVFEVEVSRTTDFKRIMSYSTERNKASIRFVGQGLFYWRVRARWRSDTIMSKTWTLTLVTS